MFLQIDCMSIELGFDTSLSNPVRTSSNPPLVAILLSTYNGSRFIGEQLESLLGQDYREIKVHIRDDGSTDGTLDILHEFAQKDSRLCVETATNIGCVRSFFYLMSKVDADIYMFCDQDDVWLPKKVSTAVRALTSAGLERPLLFHTDLVVVDEKLNTISKSFFAQQGLILPRAHDFEVLAIQNCVVGCTVAMTSALVNMTRLSKSAINSVAMHDWWLAMLASCRGEIVCSSEAEILYRQHNSNVSGARRRSLLVMLRAQFSKDGLERINSYRKKVALQSKAFLSHYGDCLETHQRTTLSRVAALDPDSGLMPVISSQFHGIRFQNTYMNIAVLYTAAVTQFVRLFRTIPF